MKEIKKIIDGLGAGLIWISRVQDLSFPLTVPRQLRLQVATSSGS